ncbi:MAG: transcriptional repressor [Bacteroidales bacterium]|nr:transcriptional repressor [Bacteroidales bacterium]
MGTEKLTESGLKMTIQRVAVLEFLEKSEEHPSAETVYNAIHEKFPSITLSTIYNTLETFVENGIISKVFTLDGKARFDAKMQKHHHLYDKKSGKIVDIFDEELNSMMTKYISDKHLKNFDIEDFQIDFTGTIK